MNLQKKIHAGLLHPKKTRRRGLKRINLIVLKILVVKLLLVKRLHHNFLKKLENITQKAKALKLLWVC